MTDSAGKLWAPPTPDKPSSQGLPEVCLRGSCLVSSTETDFHPLEDVGDMHFTIDYFIFFLGFFFLFLFMFLNKRTSDSSSLSSADQNFPKEIVSLCHVVQALAALHRVLKRSRLHLLILTRWRQRSSGNYLERKSMRLS